MRGIRTSLNRNKNSDVQLFIVLPVLLCRLPSKTIEALGKRHVERMAKGEKERDGVRETERERRSKVTVFASSEKILRLIKTV